VTGLATTGAHVFQSRVYDVQETELPALLVYTTADDVSDQSLGALIGRSVQCVVEGHAKVAANLDDTLDAISLEVEKALGVALSVGGTNILLAYDGANIALGETDKPVGVITMRFSALLYTQRTTPETIG